MTIYFDKVDIWIFQVKDLIDRFNEFYNILCDQERVRYRDLKDSKAQILFVLGRGMLKTILAEYLNISVHNLHLANNLYGKPFITNSKLHFNLSHSYPYIIFGISYDAPIGVDIEYIDSSIDLGSIANSFMVPNELRLWHKLPKDQKVLNFFRLWSAKEAYLKEKGIGFSENIVPNFFLLLDPIAVNPYPELHELVINPNFSCFIYTKKPKIIRLFLDNLYNL